MYILALSPTLFSVGVVVLVVLLWSGVYWFMDFMFVRAIAAGKPFLGRRRTFLAVMSFSTLLGVGGAVLAWLFSEKIVYDWLNLG